MSTLCLTGWGQPPDALRDIAPDALHLDYTATGSVDAALDLLSQQRADTIIGWSMGGQLAVRALATGRLQAERLVLIATPFQFVRRAGATLGMGSDTFTLFRDNLQRAPERTMRKSYALIAHNDSRAEVLNATLEAARVRLPQRDWLYWLDMLAGYDCAALSFDSMPPTLLIHGTQDAVVAPAQSETFLSHLPHAQLHTLDTCGHAPHWHDSTRVKQWIADAA